MDETIQHITEHLAGKVSRRGFLARLGMFVAAAAALAAGVGTATHALADTCCTSVAPPCPPGGMCPTGNYDCTVQEGFCCNTGTQKYLCEVCCVDNTVNVDCLLASIPETNCQF